MSWLGMALVSTPTTYSFAEKARFPGETDSDAPHLIYKESGSGGDLRTKSQMRPAAGLNLTRLLCAGRDRGGPPDSEVCPPRELRSVLRPYPRSRPFLLPPANIAPSILGGLSEYAIWVFRWLGCGGGATLFWIAPNPSRHQRVCRRLNTGWSSRPVAVHLNPRLRNSVPVDTLGLGFAPMGGTVRLSGARRGGRCQERATLRTPKATGCVSNNPTEGMPISPCRH